MKTAEQINAMISEVLQSLKVAKDVGWYEFEKANKKANKQLAFLRTCKWYIESKPSEEFIKSELVRLEGKLERIEKGFKYRLKEKGLREDRDDVRKLKTEYLKELEAPLIKKQIETLEFIYN